MKPYFLDTYALIELIAGNQNYLEVLQNNGIITTKLNLLELHYCILRLHGSEEADNCFHAFAAYCIAVEDAVLIKASRFKHQHKVRRLSYVDCVGYCLACSIGIPFLTGDKEFKGMQNVEFVR